jgi:choline dehydrogenase-like flavoprotein
LSEHVEVVVVGSGAGGGVVAGELAERGRQVVLLETGPHLTARDFTRFEAKATHELWWPIRLCRMRPDGTEFLGMVAGRCVGGSTTINTKVAFRARDHDLEKWAAASRPVNGAGEPLGEEDLAPYYDRVERRLLVRRRDDWPPSVHTVKRGFDALGAKLESVDSYTDSNCMKCGSCLQGCSTNAGKSTLNTYIHDAWATGQLDLRPGCTAQRVLVEERDGLLQAIGVEYEDGAGATRTLHAGVVVVAAGALSTPGLLMRSGIPELAGDSPSSGQIGQNLGLHPARLVYGLFDERQYCDRVYPITTHCLDHQRDEDGGFVVEATTIQDPIGFATTLVDEQGIPLWGQALVDAVDRFPYWLGMLVMANDENNASVSLDENGSEVYAKETEDHEWQRFKGALDFSRDVLLAAGASRVAWTGLLTTHVLGSCRMGSDLAKSAVDSNCESHDVKRLFVGDGSVVPRTLSVNPSLTIMALATRLADHIDADSPGYLTAGPAVTARRP